MRRFSSHRLRGPQTGLAICSWGLPPDHPLLSDARRPLDANLQAMASYVQPDDEILDVGGGAGQRGLPLSLRARLLTNIDASAVMGVGFHANAQGAGIDRIRFIHADWMDADAPQAELVLVNHVTYLTREIVPFVQKLHASARRRVLITVNDPPPPSWHRALYELVFGEEEQVVPGHVELINVLWEQGLLPDVVVLPNPTGPVPVSPTTQAAIEMALGRLPSDQWALWPLGEDLERHTRRVLESGFDELFDRTAGGFRPRWVVPGHEILITWTTLPPA